MVLKNNDRNVKNKLFKLDNVVNYRVDPVVSVNKNGEYPPSTGRFGILSGKVTTNGGVSIPNAKVSVFISSNETDETKLALYPYQNINSIFR